MSNANIDSEVWTTALKDIARALESLEGSIRSGARIRASDLKTMLDAVNELLRSAENGG